MDNKQLKKESQNINYKGNTKIEDQNNKNDLFYNNTKSNFKYN